VEPLQKVSREGIFIGESTQRSRFIMSQLRFECPSCGQHVECEKAYGGHVIHCPNCTAEIRIPFSNTAIPTELTVPKAQLVDPSTAKPILAAAEAHREFICPVCKSELRAPAQTTAPPESGLPIAELIHREPAPTGKEPPPEEKSKTEDKPAPPEEKSSTEDKPVAPESDAHKTHTEHEQEIAAARAARPVQLYPAVKPRLEYILSGAQAPSSDPAPAPDSDKGTKPLPDDHKSLHE
jgi:hypothetical protein